MSSIICTFLENLEWNLAEQEFIDFESQIRIHRIYIPQYLDAISSLYELLDAAEQKRANNYHQLKDSQRFIIARGILKILVSQYLNCQVKDVCIKVGANKKPYLFTSSTVSLEYNISHSGNWIVVAFANEAVGIDVEQIQASFNFESLLTACFSNIEQNYIQNNVNSRELFYRLWTRKESFVKATSKGLDDSLSQLTCLDGKWPLLKEHSFEQDWENWSFTLDQDHVVSICFKEGKKNILFLEQDIAN
jgi:4'-phosphopantetheinyl transferase